MDPGEIEHELTDHEDNELTDQDLAELQIEHVPALRSVAQQQQVPMENDLMTDEEEIYLVSEHSSESDGVEADNNIETDEDSVDGQQLYEESSSSHYEDRPHRILDDGPFLPSDFEDEEPVNNSRQGGVRLIPRILQVFRNFSHRRDDSDDAASQGDPRAATEDQDENFDRQLPGQHLYLGTLGEVHGRTFFDDNEVLSLPLIHYPHFVLMPGQIFPLTLFDPPSITMVRNALAGKKTFGMVSVPKDQPNVKGCIGTTAEIFEYYELDQGDPATDTLGFKVKAKGRQRFRLQSAHTDASGVRMGLVTMLPEVILSNPFNSSRLRSCDRLGDKAMKRNIQALSSLPYHVHKLYDSKSLVERIHTALSNCGWYTAGRAPTSPQDLSWWLAANLPIQDSWKYHLLGINSDIQRLRVELGILATIQVLVCKRCKNELADQSDIFSMSSDGPQGAFINPGGHIHETLTVYKAKNLKLVGHPSTEYSWFPGYAWTICECKRCYCHIGWKFTVAKEGLKPDRFYGFSRNSISSDLSSSSQESVNPNQLPGDFATTQHQSEDDEHSSNDMANLVM